MALQGQAHMGWYGEAQSDIAIACDILGVDAVAFTEIMAVTSPRVSVTRNVKYAILLTDKPWHKPSGMLGNVFDSYIHWLDTGHIRGQKTRPFADALLGDHTAIPLDVWMCQALRIRQLSLRRNDVFTRATQHIADVADYLGWWNCEAQAAIWATAVRAADRNVMVVSAADLALAYVTGMPEPKSTQRTLEYTS